MPQMHLSDSLFWVLIELFLIYGTACLAIVGFSVVLSALLTEIRGKKNPGGEPGFFGSKKQKG
jgi:hypothetical protein